MQKHKPFVSGGRPIKDSMAGVNGWHVRSLLKYRSMTYGWLRSKCISMQISMRRNSRVEIWLSPRITIHHIPRSIAGPICLYISYLHFSALNFEACKYDTSVAGLRWYYVVPLLCILASQWSEFNYFSIKQIHYMWWRFLYSGSVVGRINKVAVSLHLSLIHIWRCRRIERCRSRWSPYH